jgi:hypothetical protein
MTSRPIQALLAALLLLAPAAHAQWTAPTPEELSMTAQPEVPGAAAVVLYRERTSDDETHYESNYVRIKVLTEKGKDYADVELPYNAGAHAGFNVTDIQGRTIHSDGTIVPFTGKPYQKLIHKTSDSKVMSKVFSLPDVQPGSILEYRYKLRYDDNYFVPPHWTIQTDLFTRKAHYMWMPTNRQLEADDDSGTLVSHVAWFPLLPRGTSVSLKQTPPVGMNMARNLLTLDVQNVPPIPKEDYLPPLDALRYQVLFYYTPYKSSEEFWAKQGSHWAKQADRFIGPGPGAKAAVQTLAAPSDAPLVKLQKFYQAVMLMENTDFTRSHTATEEHAIRNTDDVLAAKSGTGDQLTELFVALARAAGLKAYLAAVTNRDQNTFIPAYLSLGQLDDYLAIVSLDGKDTFFDPGQRYASFQHIAWKHSNTSGIRQTDKGAAIVVTPSESFKSSTVKRIADLTLDNHGVATGSVTFSFSGAPALRWRHASLLGDITSLHHELTESCEQLFGKNVEIKIDSIENLTDYEQPLSVTYTIKGPIGNTAGSRLLIPADPFEAASQPTFPGKERNEPVDFHYAYIMQDAVRIHIPAGLTLESLPKPAKTQIPNIAVYNFAVDKADDSFTIHRDLVVGHYIFQAAQYQDLRTFYTTFETQDHEPVVLKAAAAPTPPAGN